MQEKRRALLRGLRPALQIQAEILHRSGEDFKSCVANLIIAESAKDKNNFPIFINDGDH